MRHVRLTAIERIGLAFAALRALDPALREAAFCAAPWGEAPGAGASLPPFDDIMEDAHWCDARASRREREAYALADFEALGPRDRAALLALHGPGRRRVGGMTEAELDEIMLLHWPGTLRRAMTDGDDWTRGFVRSIARAVGACPDGWGSWPGSSSPARALHMAQGRV